MSPIVDVAVLDEGLDPNDLLEGFAASHPHSGAVGSFLGQVRGDGVEALELTHYAPLTLPGMEGLAQTALERWALDGVLIRHRIGRLLPGDPIVVVAAAARHRRAALEAVDFLMDHLKSAAWFWKREFRGGQWRWIEPREQDHIDRARWP